jgi:tetratricopeptide (TPR) repeat protein
MTGYFVLRTGTVDWRSVAEAAHAAALADGDPAALAATELALGMADQYQGRYDVSAEHFVRCAALAEQAGWTQCRAVALNNLARSHWTGGRADESIAWLTEALELHRASGRAAGEAVTLANLGSAQLYRSRDPELDPDARHERLERATALLTEALAVHRRIGDSRNEADTLRLFAEARRDLGGLDEALEKAGAALELARAAEDVRFEVNALNLLATVHVRSGRTVAGLEHHAEALETARDVGDPRLSAETHLAAADSYTRLGRDEEAVLHIDDARDLARQTRSVPLERQCERALAALHEAVGAGAASDQPPAAVR